VTRGARAASSDPPGLVPAYADGSAGPAATAMSLIRAAHPGPAMTVTTVTGLLAVAAALPTPTAVTATAAVFAGQLTIGWGNDLGDAERDAAVGRADKPLAVGQLDRRTVRRAIVPAAAACALLSGRLGWRAAAVHLGLGVSAGHAYNLHLKTTALSWLPYASAFGSLPAVVSLAGPEREWPPAYVLLAGACLGVGAHLLNALPDLSDDAVTGVRGLPHRLGARPARAVAALLLGTASAATILGPRRSVDGPAAAALTGAGGLVGVTLLGRGRVPFAAAMTLAVLDVVLLARATR
jgi:4-hydroxybenzoate polyprenyltransferase